MINAGRHSPLQHFKWLWSVDYAVDDGCREKWNPRGRSWGCRRIQQKLSAPSCVCSKLTVLLKSVAIVWPELIRSENLRRKIEAKKKRRWCGAHGCSINEWHNETDSYCFWDAEVIGPLEKKIQNNWRIQHITIKIATKAATIPIDLVRYVRRQELLDSIHVSNSRNLKTTTKKWIAFFGRRQLTTIPILRCLNQNVPRRKQKEHWEFSQIFFLFSPFVTNSEIAGKNATHNWMWNKFCVSALWRGGDDGTRCEINRNETAQRQHVGHSQYNQIKLGVFHHF